MKKCKWCEAKIEDDVATCPFCRANQEIEYDDTTQKNHVEDFLKKYPGGRTTPKWQREESKPIIMCPTCKSVNVQSITTKSRFDSIFLFGIFSNKINKSFECKNCGYTW